jgi:hypothetical protein
MNTNPFESPPAEGGRPPRSAFSAVLRGMLIGAILGLGFIFLQARGEAQQRDTLSAFIAFPCLGAFFGGVIAGLARQRDKKRN